MNMSQLSLPTYQLIFIYILYIAYLCLVMFGGMRKKQAKLRRFIFMIILLFWALTETYDGIKSLIEIIDLIIIIVISIIKGLYLGHKKHIEKIDNTYYIWHDFSYVTIWFLFFVGKIFITSCLKYFTGATIPLWHMVFYFCIYFTLRSIVVVYLHPKAFQKI